MSNANKLKLRLPFVSRKKYEADKGRTIVYVPVERPVDKDYCYHDKRIGWVKRLEFANYDDYIKYLASALLQKHIEGA
jgi:hypothetical protein